MSFLALPPVPVPPESPVPPDPGRRRRRAPGTAGLARIARRLGRRGLALLAAVLAATVALAAALVLAFSGSSGVPPATGAASVVPADALAYVSLSTDGSRPAVKLARTLAARFPDWPLLASAAVNRVGAIVGGSSSVEFASAVRPWLGNQAAFAVVPAAAGSPQSLVALEVARPARARAFVTDAGATSAGAYDGVRLLAYRSGTELAFVGRYLVAGPDAALRAAIDAARGRARSLSHDGAYERAVASEPADRVLDAYLPAAGIRQLLVARTGIAGAVGLLLDRPSLEGAAISLSPAANGARVIVHSALGGRATRTGTSAPAYSFRPTLQSVLPSGSTLMLDVAGLDRAGPMLLQAAARAGIAANVGPLLRRLGAALASEGVNLHNALSLFDGEAAVAISPGPTPALLIVARVRNENAATSELASLAGPVSALFAPSRSGGVQVPELSERPVGGTTVHELRLGPGLQVNFGVFNGLVVVSTSVAAIDSVAQRVRSLADDAAYRATLSDPPNRLSSLVFADFNRLLALGAQTGLTSGARIRKLMPDLAKIRAIGLSSARGRTDTTTELTLEIP